jgi:hypothetical protein
MTLALLTGLVLFASALALAIVVQDWRGALLSHAEGDPLPGAPPAGITVVVPARNAAETLPALLQDLAAQRYPRDRYEVLVVDDHSTDATTTVVRGMVRQWPVLRLVQAVEGQGKKAALTMAVQEATFDLLLVTDADARCGPDRLALLAAHQHRTGSAFTILPVRTAGGAGASARLQTLEQLALQGATLGAALGGAPVLANGANMAFTREAFLRVGGYHGDRWAGGDDLFLLQRMRFAGLPVTCLADPGATVFVEPAAGWAGALRQRLRWAGKMRGYSDGWGQWAARAVVLVPVLLLAGTAVVARLATPGAGFAPAWGLTLAAWVLFAAPAIALTRTTARLFTKGPEHPSAVGEGVPSVPATAFALLAFMIYAPVIAVLSIFVRPQWKGRRA